MAFRQVLGNNVSFKLRKEGLHSSHFRLRWVFLILMLLATLVFQALPFYASWQAYLPELPLLLIMAMVSFLSSSPLMLWFAWALGLFKDATNGTALGSEGFLYLLSCYLLIIMQLSDKTGDSVQRFAMVALIVLIKQTIGLLTLSAYAYRDVWDILLIFIVPLSLSLILWALFEALYYRQGIRRQSLVR